ncbi:MAG: ATP synthase F1 subunit gamma [Elusimicrobia bacterium]|nr:ATP synthase F1 subunit gamma [Elusimicrobiota bacterium]
MASLREWRRKIKSVKSTQQITRAMKMVAAARMRKAQQSILSSRPFAARMEKMVMDLSFAEKRARELSGRAGQVHPFFERSSSGHAGLLLIASDKGLCGGFNANLLREALGWLRKNSGKKIYAAVVGKKGANFLSRYFGGDPDFKIISQLVDIFPKAGFVHAELLGRALTECYEKAPLRSVTVIYNEFKSAVQQRVVSAEILPMLPPASADGGRVFQEFSFEPDRTQLIHSLLPRYFKAQLFRFLLESQAAELAARMNAMDAATKNADDLIETLTLRLNQTRQAIITREIAELVGGAEALAS